MVFLKNDRALGVKNGMLGTVEQADSGRLSVILDNGERRTVNQGGYDAVDHGYAVTVHKAQGVTVDRAFVLATGGMDRHLAYVAMTRHRDSVVMYAGKAEFGGYEGLSSKLSRARPKESVLDFIERRDIATPRSWIEDGRAVLTSLSDRFSAVVDRLRERFEPETLKGNEHERPNGDRQPTQVDGRATARADAKRSRPGAGKPDLGRIGEVPPPFARGRLRSLSELGVVRFAERGEVLLPHDVPHNVEHQGAERNNALRRDGDGLNEKPASVRETIQGEVNAAQLRELVKQREGERFPSVAANDTRPEKIKADWQAEKSRQFSLVVDKARRVQARAAGQMERQEGKLSRLDQARPQEPTGLLASFKKAAHDQALTGWRTVRAGLEKRFNQVRGRLNSINDYTRKAGPYELPTKGERLAESLAKKARPELAGNFQRVAEKEKAAAIELQRAKIMNRNQEKQERRTMKQESIEELKQRTDKNRVAAEKAERTELDKAGHLARLQGESSEQQSSSAGKDLSAGAEKAGEGTDARKREILERFKEKAAKDRSNEKGRGGR
ncbi:MAG: ATP-binding domain-containing protein [Polaromonas sp.]|nr:ATP-binding domain-containing protein [Polaromonas sp.]